MIYRGQVHGDVIVLSGGVRLPEGTHVLVEPVEKQTASTPISESSIRNGVPVFLKIETATAPTIELVNAIRDDAP